MWSQMCCVSAFSMYFARFVSTWWHWLDVSSINLLRWKTKQFAFTWSARRIALKPVVTTTLNSLPTILWWLLCDRLPWLPDIEGTSPSICAAAIASTSPRSNLPALPLPPFHHFSPPNTNAIHSEKRGEGRGFRHFESSCSRRTELSQQRQERKSD